VFLLEKRVPLLPFVFFVSLVVGQRSGPRDHDRH
jgi:hypothetical protein